MKRLPLFTTWQWATIVGGLVVAGVSVTAFAFTTFVPRWSFESFQVYLDKRLDRLECKIDPNFPCPK